MLPSNISVLQNITSRRDFGIFSSGGEWVKLLLYRLKSCNFFLSQLCVENYNAPRREGHIFFKKYITGANLVAIGVVVTVYVTPRTTAKPVLSSHSKIDKTRILMTNGSLMKVESIGECSPWNILNAFDLHQAIIDLENQIWSF